MKLWRLLVGESCSSDGASQSSQKAQTRLAQTRLKSDTAVMWKGEGETKAQIGDFRLRFLRRDERVMKSKAQSVTWATAAATWAAVCFIPRQGKLKNLNWEQTRARSLSKIAFPLQRKGNVEVKGWTLPSTTSILECSPCAEPGVRQRSGWIWGPKHVAGRNTGK